MDIISVNPQSGLATKWIQYYISESRYSR